MFIGVVCFCMVLDYVFVIMNMKLRVDNEFFWFCLVLKIFVVDGIVLDVIDVK